MREVIGLVRLIVAKAHTGELGLLQGEYHRLDLRNFRTFSPPVRSAIPIFLPAVFEKACELAGEIADGLLGHPLWNEKWIAEQATPAMFLEQWSQCQKALDRLADEIAAADPELVIIVGDDQEELFDLRCMPAFAVYCGEQIVTRPLESMDYIPRWLVASQASAGYAMDTVRHYPAAPEFGRFAIDHCDWFAPNSGDYQSPAGCHPAPRDRTLVFPCRGTGTTRLYNASR